MINHISSGRSGVRAAFDPTVDLDGQWGDEPARVFLEIKQTHSARDVRNAFLHLAYALRSASSSTQAVCVLVDSRLSQQRLMAELLEFREVVRPDLAARIHFLAGPSQPSSDQADDYAWGFRGSFDNAPEAFYAHLPLAISLEVNKRGISALPPRQVLLAALTQQRLSGAPPVTAAWLQKTCHVSYPTVSQVVDELGYRSWLETGEGNGIRLRPLTGAEWMALGRDYARLRKVHWFHDPTGQSSPTALVRRLARLQQDRKLPITVRVGGVVGASRHFPDLDITAPPRLDLSVEFNPSLVASLLDAGLVPRKNPDQSVAMALHMSREPCLPAPLQPVTEAVVAGELECLADLLEMGFDREAGEMARFLEQKNRNNEVRP